MLPVISSVYVRMMLSNLTRPLFLLSFETYYDPMPVVNWMQHHPMVPIAACVAYGILIGLGQRYFSSRERWNWRKTMAAWNLGLSIFSSIGLARTAPQLAHNLWTYSARDNLCLDPSATFGSGSSGLWVQLFILSKFPYVFISST